MIKILAKKVQVSIQFHENSINVFYFFSGLKWHEFGWEKYIKKDITTIDSEDPYKRFAINIVNSVKIGVNRTIPDHR